MVYYTVYQLVHPKVFTQLILLQKIAQRLALQLLTAKSRIDVQLKFHYY